MQNCINDLPSLQWFLLEYTRLSWVEEYALALFFFKVHVKGGGAARLRVLKKFLLTGKRANYKTRLGGA